MALIRLNFILLLICLASSSWAQINPSTLSGLELWVNADEGIQYFGASVLQWNDQSGNENHLVQLSANRRPVLSSNTINGKQAMLFDGSNDYMDFTSSIDNIRTVFWVISEDEDASETYRCLLGHSDTFNFLRGDEGTLWNQTFADPGVLEGVTRINSQEIILTETPLPNGFKVISLKTSAPVEANRFSLDRTFNATVWDGELAQLMIFSEALDDSEIQGVEDFIYYYYTDELDLGEDIFINDNFCDTTLIATPGYINYEWSDGSSNDSLVVNSSGIYWVDATDVFGRVVRDSIEVNYPGNFSPGESFLCLGESFTWDLELDPVDYNITWQDGSSDAFFTVDEDSLLSVTIIDANECAFSPDPISVTVDDFSEQVSLGDDQALCVGQSIVLQGGDFPGLSYLWSDDSDAAEFIYEGQSQVWVEVMNANGCIATDTIQTSSLGNAPVVDFSFENTCEGDLTAFINESSSEAELVSWEWDFYGLETDTGEEVNFEFPGPGEFQVALEVTDNNGCSNRTEQQVYIYNNPEAQFTFDLLCEDSESDFLDQSSSEDGDIVSWNWQFPNGSSTDQNPTYDFVDSGFQNVALEVETELGCEGSFESLVDVRPGPVAEILFEGNCFGEFSELSYEYTSNGAGDAQSQLWQFGDATSSSEESPQHFYQLPNPYTILLLVEADNGCFATEQLDVVISPPPNAQIANLDFCVGQEEEFEDSSSSFDPIVDWNWSSSILGDFNGESPSVIFNGEGQSELSLFILTEAGCTDEVSQTVTVHATPEFEISYSPEVGLPPLEVTAVAASEEILSYTWMYNNSSLEGEEVELIFEEEGISTFEVQGTSVFGCSSSQLVEIPIVEPRTDIEMIALSEAEEFPVAYVENGSNYTIRELRLLQRYMGGNPSVEFWSGELPPGQILIYEFNSVLEPLNFQESIICAEAHVIGGLSEDINPLNNEDCEELGFIEASLLEPYPNPAGDHMIIQAHFPQSDEVRFSIYNYAGQRVWSTKQFQTTSGYNRFPLSLPELQTGIYVLKMDFRDKEYTQYFMKD